MERTATAPTQEETRRTPVDGGTKRDPPPPTESFNTAAHHLIVFFLSHGWLNVLLLSPLNPLRCTYWKIEDASSTVSSCGQSFTAEEDTLLHWLVLSMGHLHLVLTGLALRAVGHPLLEYQILVFLVVVAVAFMSAGIFFLQFVSFPMAMLQVVVWMVVLVAAAYVVSATTIAVSTVSTTNGIPSTRPKLPSMATMVMMIQAMLSAAKVVHRVLPRNSQEPLSVYSFQYTSPTAHAMAQLTLAYDMWSALLLVASVLVATPMQQKTVLLLQSIYFLAVCLVLMTGYTTAAEETKSLVQRETTAAVGALMLAVVGACS